jgi:hypothetical protein
MPEANRDYQPIHLAQEGNSLSLQSPVSIGNAAVATTRTNHPAGRADGCASHATYKLARALSGQMFSIAHFRFAIGLLAVFRYHPRPHPKASDIPS